MTQTYAYGKLNWYPHLMPEDVAVWERFIAAYPSAYDSCQYDLPVGSIPDFVKEGTPEDHASMEKLYKKKIDVIGHKGTDLDIVELKPQCTMSTIGQVKGYVHLFTREHGDGFEPKPVVVCGGAHPDVLDFAEAEGVRVIVV